MDVLRKSLETIALGYSQGNISIDILIKACENYKIKNNLVDDLDYEIKVAKSCIDYLNNVPQDAEILKAIVPGQTKVLDGVVYVYSKTKAGSKEEYGWHVVRKGAKTTADVGRGSTLSDSSIKAKQKYVNDLFPNDLSALKVVNAHIGGSTGASLMQDANGNQYILKKGANTSADHVKNEYLSNQLYGILGLTTPDYELYEDNGEVYLLSRFIQGTHEPNANDFAEMAKGFMADCLLANWDVYQNDNCLIKNATGQVIRVDNGSCLEYRARGSKKVFDKNFKATYDGMVSHNPGIMSRLDIDDQLKQIEELSKKRDDVVNFLKESGQDALAQIMSDRFDGMKDVVDALNKEKAKQDALKAAKLGRVIPRTLKSKADMYAEFDEQQMKQFVDDTAADTGYQADSPSLLTAQKRNTEGWALLSTICKARGFDARPRVVDEKKFWELREKTKQPMMFRGFEDVSYVDDFRFNDRCHFGCYGIWGQGIYAHSDDSSHQGKSKDVRSGATIDKNSDKTNYKSSPAYSGSESAMSYSSHHEERILKMCWEPDAKIVNSEDLLEEIKGLSGLGVTPQAKKLKKELDAIKAEWTKNKIALMNIADTVKAQVYAKIGYDEASVSSMLTDISNTNWGARNAQGELSYPKFDKFIKGVIKPCVEACGGKAELIDEGTESERIRFKIGKSELFISKYSWDHNAVKQKNQFTSAYHNQCEKFVAFFDTACVKPATDAVQKELAEGNVSKQLKSVVIKNEADYYAKKRDYDNEVNNTAADNLLGRIYKTCKDLDYRDSGSSKSVLGIYAALKGYDGIYQPDGNDSGHGFVVILNRSKIITTI